MHSRLEKRGSGRLWGKMYIVVHVEAAALRAMGCY